MIETFRHKGLRRLYEDDNPKGLSSNLVERLRVVLADLELAAAISDLHRPGFRLHSLKGDRRGFWSITVSANWRVVFRFEDGKVFDIDLVDYH